MRASSDPFGSVPGKEKYGSDEHDPDQDLDR